MDFLEQTIVDREIFQQQLLLYFKNYQNIVFLNSNLDKKVNIIAVSNQSTSTTKDWQFGFVSYDYKNNIEQLVSKNNDNIEFPDKLFFTPEIMVELHLNKVVFKWNPLEYNKNKIFNIINDIKKVSIKTFSLNNSVIKSRVSKTEYIDTVEQLLEHIKKGNIYEINYCQEFFIENVCLNPIELYFKLNTKSPTPFSCFVKHENKYLLSASPERFIKKTGDKLISQPIKGTSRRGNTKQEDILLKNNLKEDLKELSENVMIVDLVRNDISKIAERGTVKVDELFGIYTFPQVHQMISTISGKLKKDITFNEILKATFPMGSMTGAPKIMAMKLIDKFEKTKRGLYSGTVGYISPNGDFDFNVVIRSILYNSDKNYLSFMVGGAITSNSDPEKEFDECMLKAKAIFEVLSK